METKPNNLKRNIYIGLALIVGAIFTLLIVSSFIGGDAADAPGDGNDPSIAFTCDGLLVKILEDTDGDGDTDCDDLPSLNNATTNDNDDDGNETIICKGLEYSVPALHVDKDNDGDIDCDDIYPPDHISCITEEELASPECIYPPDENLPDDWHSLTSAEKTALNPLGCETDDNDDVHLSAETGECLWDLYVYDDEVSQRDDGGYYGVEGEEEETPISLEELQAYMQDPATAWGIKYYRLEQFIAYHDPTPLSCVDISSDSDNAWESLKTTRQNASGDLRIFLDEFIGLI